jgi:hypothetical protein
MENTETCDLSPFIEYIVPFLPLYCDFLNFQEKNSLTKLENIENCILTRLSSILCRLWLDIAVF